MILERVMVSMQISQIDQKYVEGTMMDNIRILSDDQLPMDYDYQNARKQGKIFREINVTTKGFHVIEYSVLDYRVGGDILGKRKFDKHEVTPELLRNKPHIVKS